jgi:hypothetical protein
VGLFNAGILPGGHEAREVGGVGEEGEDGFERVGEPLLGLEVVAHQLPVWAKRLGRLCGARFFLDLLKADERILRERCLSM